MIGLGRLTAVILNWRTADLTLRAARALLDDGLPAERLVLVDNASGDGSAEALRREHPDSIVLALDENLGFARANNRGAGALEGDAYLFVNSDAFVRRAGSLARMLRALDDPAVGVVVPRLVNPDGTLQPSVVPISRPLSELARASGLSRLIPNRWQPTLSTHWDHSESRRIEAAIGAVILARGTLWHHLGGFDESRFMYAEDLELFRRVADAGAQVRFEADAEFTHLGGASAGSRWSDPERAERVAHAEAEMIRGHLPPRRAAVTIGLMRYGAAMRAVVGRLRGDEAAAAEHRAWYRGYTAGRRG